MNKRIIAILMALAMVMALAACGSSSEANGDTAETQYVGSAETDRGILKVQVTMDGEKISNIEVLEHHETEGICDKALTDIPAAIIEKNSTEVDTISGATQTSKAIMQAVEDALSKVQK